MRAVQAESTWAILNLHSRAFNAGSLQLSTNDVFPGPQVAGCKLRAPPWSRGEQVHQSSQTAHALRGSPLPDVCHRIGSMLPRPTAAFIVVLPGLARNSSWCCLGAIQSTLPHCHRPRTGRNKRRFKPGRRSHGEHGGLGEQAGTIPQCHLYSLPLQTSRETQLRLSREHIRKAS